MPPPSRGWVIRIHRAVYPPPCQRRTGLIEWLCRDEAHLLEIAVVAESGMQLYVDLGSGPWCLSCLMACFSAGFNPFQTGCVQTGKANTRQLCLFWGMASEPL